MGRGRNPSPQQQPGGGQYGGGQYGGGPGVPPCPGTGPQGSAPPRPPGAPHGGPQYYGQPGISPGYGRQDDNPGHTRAFTIGDSPDYWQPGHGDPGHQQGYGPAAPRLHWKQLLSGIILRPQQTFVQMRDYQVWAPALIVTFIYGLFLSVFGFEETREQILDNSVSTSVPQVLMGGVAVVFSMAMLGAVTNALARQLGGVGAWAPTIGLSMLITSMTDVPRVLFAIFLHVDNQLVTIVGWVTWALGGALLTMMVGKSHELPWPRALGACSIQLVALFALHALPSLSG